MLRRKKKRAPIVLLVGPDGAGKSAVSAMISDAAETFGREVISYHYRPNILFTRVAGDASQPHSGGESMSLVRAAVKLAATFVDTWVGLRRRCDGRKVVVVERGWFDQLVDPIRYRLPTSSVPLSRALGRLSPKADLVMRLEADPAVVANRKPELSPSEVARQAQVWTSLASCAGRTVWPVPTDVAIDETAARVMAGLRSVIDGTWRTVGVWPSPTRLQLRVSRRQQVATVPLLYRPQTARAMGALRLANAAAPLREALPGRPDALAAMVATAAGLQDITGTCSFVGSRPGRRVIGYVRRERLVAVAKLNLTGTDAGLRREIEIAGLQRSASDRVGVARAILARSVMDWDVLVTEAVPPATRQWTWDDVIDACVAIQHSADGPWVHGDLAPWNLTAAEGRIFILDWESSTRRHAPMADLLHFTVSTGALLGRFSPEQAISMLMSPQGPAFRLAERVGVTPREVRSLARSEAQALASTPDQRGCFAAELLVELDKCES